MTQNQNWILKPIFKTVILLIFVSVQLGISVQSHARSKCAKGVDTSALIDDIKKNDPDTLSKKHQNDHFQSKDPLVFEAEHGVLKEDQISLRMMGANFEHLNRDQYSRPQWERKIQAFGKTIWVERPDVIAANEVYDGGLRAFQDEILSPMGYTSVIDERGGKEIFGGQMSVGVIYNYRRIQLISTESIEIDVPAAVQRTRNIFRLEMQHRSGGAPFILYVVHFKSPREMNTPISTPGGGKLSTSDELRKQQMAQLARRMQADRDQGYAVFAMGDFNTPFTVKDFVNKDNPSQRAYQIGKKQKLMVWSSGPMNALIASSSGADVLTDLDGYSHVYRSRGSKLDHIVFIPPLVQNENSVRILEVGNRRILRYPWHLSPQTGFPLRRSISDHLFYSADIILARPISP
jgi:hypothetical protein